MNKISLIAALALAGTVSATALVPATYAQTTAQPSTTTAQQGVQVADRGFGMRGGQGMMQHDERGEHRQFGFDGQQMNGHMMRGAGARGGFLNLACSEDGPALLELRLNSIARRVTLDDTQQPLYDAFKAAALTAETTYADSCTPLMRGQTGGSGDLVADIKVHQENLKSQITAMDDVLPSLEAFYNSLTDEQKAQLTPMRVQQGDGPQQGWGYHFKARPGANGPMNGNGPMDGSGPMNGQGPMNGNGPMDGSGPINGNGQNG